LSIQHVRGLFGTVQLAARLLGFGRLSGILSRQSLSSSSYALVVAAASGAGQEDE
jgi:hypothetical protein